VNRRGYYLPDATPVLWIFAVLCAIVGWAVIEGVLWVACWIASHVEWVG
jgi:hypothetical protein